jgi:hypothetical protein
MMIQPDYYGEREKTQAANGQAMAALMGQLIAKKMEQNAANKAQEANAALIAQMTGQGGAMAQPSAGTPAPNVATPQGGQIPMIPQRKITMTANGPQVSVSMIPDPMALAKQKADMIMTRQKEMADYNQKLKGEAPLSADAAGRYALSKEALRAVPQARNVLFPDGTPKSFNRTLATAFMVGKIPNNKESQTIKRALTKVATARGLIQSGTVVKDNEWARIVNDMMGVDAFSNPESLFQMLGEEEKFHQEFMTLVRPGFKGGTKAGGDAQDDSSTLKKLGLDSSKYEIVR